MEDFGTGTHRQLGPVGVEGVGAYATVVIVPIAVEYTETPGCLLLQGIAVLQTHKNVVHTAGLLFGQHIQRQPQTQKGAVRFVVVSLFGKAYILKTGFSYKKPVLRQVHARKKGNAGPVAIEQLVERPCQIDAQSKALVADPAPAGGRLLPQSNRRLINIDLNILKVFTVINSGVFNGYRIDKHAGKPHTVQFKVEGKSTFARNVFQLTAVPKPQLCPS